MTDLNASRHRANRRARGELEIKDFWLTRERRCALVAAGMLDKSEIDDPGACAEAFDFVLAGLTKRYSGR